MNNGAHANALPARLPSAGESAGDAISPRTAKGYCGRFAPSPTGPLHVGSLIAALASCLEARQQGGRWLVRIDDLDTPRCSAAAATSILHSLDAFGFEYDAPLVWQSRRGAPYAEALARLQAHALAYPCVCTRRELADSLLAPDGASIYPGTCRNGLRVNAGTGSGTADRQSAWRVRVADQHIDFADRIQGPQRTHLPCEVGDFVVRRSDGLFAYQLATVIDDADAGVTDVLRGADLLASTPRQIWLQQCLGLTTPTYAHVPVAVNPAGEKLSKQTLARALDDAHPVPALVSALGFLGQNPPADLRRASLREVWDWARSSWQEARVPRAATKPWKDL